MPRTLKSESYNIRENLKKTRVLYITNDQYMGIIIFLLSYKFSAVERPMPIGCSIQSTSNDDIGDVQANVITGMKI